MKTKSIRARVDDAKKIEQVSRILAVELDRQVSVSEVLNELTEYLEDAKERIKNKNGNTSKEK